MTARPDSLASSSTPRATSVKNGFATSSTTSPMVRLRPARSWRADSFLMKPSCLMAACTRLRVGSATTSGRLSTFETVPTETPAYAATSLMLTGALATVSLSLLCRKCAVIHWNVSNRPAWHREEPRPRRETRAAPGARLSLCVSSAVRWAPGILTGRLCNDSTTGGHDLLTPTSPGLTLLHIFETLHRSAARATPERPKRQH